MDLLIDAHDVIWFITADSKLPLKTKRIIDIKTLSLILSLSGMFVFNSCMKDKTSDLNQDYELNDSIIPSMAQNFGVTSKGYDIDKDSKNDIEFTCTEYNSPMSECSEGSVYISLKQGFEAFFERSVYNNNYECYNVVVDKDSTELTPRIFNLGDSVNFNMQSVNGTLALLYEKTTCGYPCYPFYEMRFNKWVNEKDKYIVFCNKTKMIFAFFKISILSYGEISLNRLVVISDSNKIMIK